ncbi:MAG: hypothetical protein IJW86_08215 [Clostridia bacterium]|nr:hypothetical protein [Clostridia bacterium]
MDKYFGNSGKKISWVQICFLLCILMLAFIIFAVLLNGAAAFTLSSAALALPLLIVGTVSIIIAAMKKSTLKGKIWLLSDGAATTVLAAVLLLSGKENIETLPFYFGLWEIAIGIFKIAESHQLKNGTVHSHEGFLYIGIAQTVSGALFLIRPIDRLIGHSIAVVITLAIQMSAYGLRYYLYPTMSEE